MCVEAGLTMTNNIEYMECYDELHLKNNNKKDLWSSVVELLV